MKKFVIASSNEHKIAEFKKMLSPFNIKVVSYKDILKDDFEIEETGKTFVENAKLKAETIANKTKLPTFADDSGLCITSLNGEPGLFSARYAKAEGGYENAFAKLEERLKSKDKDAYFICVIAFARPDNKTEIFEGRCNGFINFPARGQDGFGYDPIFVPNGMGRTFAELSEDEKNSISHRAFAMEKFASFLIEEEKKKDAELKSKTKTSKTSSSKTDAKQPSVVKEVIKETEPVKTKVKVVKEEVKKSSENPMEEFIEVDAKLNSDENN